MKIPFKVHTMPGSVFNNHTNLERKHTRITSHSMTSRMCIIVLGTPRWTIILALTGWVGARVVICRNGNVEIIVRSQFCDKPTNLCSDRQETGHNDRWTSSGITLPLQNCHYMLHHHITFDSDTSETTT